LTPREPVPKVRDEAESRGKAQVRDLKPR
jgi:hypothetical protein